MNAAFSRQRLLEFQECLECLLLILFSISIFSPTTMTSDITVPKGLKKAKIQILLIFIYRAHSPHCCDQFLAPFPSGLYKYTLETFSS